MKTGYIILVLVLSFLLVSCGEAAQRGKDINYKQGILDIEVSSLGQKEEYQGQQLELPVSVHNALAYGIENVLVYVTGFDNYYVELYSDEEQLASLEGKSIFNSDGGKERIQFSGLLNQLLPGAEKEEQNYRIQVKYDSKVEFTPTICVTSDLGLGEYGMYQGACTVERELSYPGQGAPLAVTKLEVIPRGGSGIELRMDIENKGKGMVDTVALVTASLGGKPLNCIFKGGEAQTGSLFSLDAQQKSARLICTGSLASESPYTTNLQVELWYDYEITQKETLTILGDTLVS
ncbi:MAG TPA: hypothetical protein VJA18_06625 [Candidatus Nanoarchaeia archaeon]|nr:hypothetical protein [Candidatus Nanoarchaeia archaeon]